MTEQDSVFLQTSRPEDFAFDERVAKVFDNMVSRSVPFYNEVQRIQSDLIMDFLPEDSGLVCDLGCSTGTTIRNARIVPGLLDMTILSQCWIKPVTNCLSKLPPGK